MFAQSLGEMDVDARRSSGEVIPGSVLHEDERWVREAYSILFMRGSALYNM